MSLMWMSSPTQEALKKNQYTNGPSPWWNFHPDHGDIIVAKNRRGETVICETWEGDPIPIPDSHSKVTSHG